MQLDGTDVWHSPGESLPNDNGAYWRKNLGRMRLSDENRNEQPKNRSTAVANPSIDKGD